MGIDYFEEVGMRVLFDVGEGHQLLLVLAERDRRHGAEEVALAGVEPTGRVGRKEGLPVRSVAHDLHSNDYTEPPHDSPQE